MPTRSCSSAIASCADMVDLLSGLEAERQVLVAFSLVIVSEARMISFGTCSSTRSDMPLPWAISRASEIAEEAIDGL